MNNIEELIREYRAEVNGVIGSFFTWKNINNLAAGKREYLQALNANALFWNTTAYALQSMFLVGLGRIFDKDNRSLTVNRFLIECKNRLNDFSKSALETRRIKESNGQRPDWLDSYLSTVYEPTAADFEALLVAVQPHEAAYRKNYEPIRHKVIAHKDYATIGAKEALFANTNIGEIEAILTALYQIQRVVDELLLNGRITRISDFSLTEERHVQTDLEKLLTKLASD